LSEVSCIYRTEHIVHTNITLVNTLYVIFNAEKERRERKLRGNEMRRRYRERSLPTANDDVEGSVYNSYFIINYHLSLIVLNCYCTMIMEILTY